MAAELGIAVAAKALELLDVRPAHCVGRHVGYAWNCKKHIRKLRSEVEMLKDSKRRMKHRVKEARRKGDKIEPDVEAWLKSAKELIKEAEKFLQDEETANKKFFMYLCPDWKTNYQLGRKAKREKVKLVELMVKNKEIINESVSYHEAPKSIGPVKGYVSFESRISIIKGIKEALEDPYVTKIGVFGINGVGKTTLAREIARQAKEENLFDEVVMASVFQDQSMKEMQREAVARKTPVLRRIQGEIADGLDFQFHMETERGRADELCERLKDVSTKLVVLDNVWAGFQLEDVGIPSDHKGLKILMISTNQNVLLSEMGSKQNFQLDILPLSEARDWFKELVGDVVEDPTLQEVACQLADRCAGLPILLVAVAKGLKDNGDLEAWNSALKQLSSFDKEEMHASVHSALQLSYNLLGGKEIKSLFSLCAQLPHYEIDVKELLKYGVGLGLLKQSNTLEGARNRLLKLVSDLKASCLLLEGNKHGRLKMHNIVHNFATSIASRDYGVFIVAYNGVLPQWPIQDACRRFAAISLPYCKIPELPEVFECPNLMSFIFLSKDPQLKIPDTLFGRMKELRVLELANLHFPSLPSSLKYTENLRTLSLKHCVLGDMRVIKKLKKLQILSFLGSDIVELPSEIRKLTNLRLLDLSNCPRLEVIPPNVLSCLTQLEGLYMENSYVNWESEGERGRRNNANLAELKLLSNLNTLEIHITAAHILPKGLLSEKLQKYKIFVGDGWDWSGEYKTSRTLKLKLNTSNQLEKWIKVLLKRTEDLYLDELKGAQNSLYELDGQGFPQLKHLHVQNSDGIQYVIKSTGVGCAAFSRLESLFLSNLKNLEKIYHGQPITGSFSSLRMLKVETCDRLKNLFSSIMARGLLLLDEINITNCKIMEQMIIEESEDAFEGDEVIKLPHLRTLMLESLPHFKSICSKVKAPSVSRKNLQEINAEIEPDTAMPLFSEKVNFPNLKVLILSTINIEKIWDDQLLESSPWFKNLTSLHVHGCYKLKYLISSSTTASLVNLKSLHICNCKMMEEIIFSERMSNMLLCQLNFLKLKDLPKLVTFCSSDLFECPVLKWLSIENCPVLRTFVSNSIAAGSSETETMKSTLFDEKVAFPCLETLEIFNMNRLETIWHNELHEDSFSKLKKLDVRHAEELQNIFPCNYMLSRFQSLEILFLADCNSLEEVFHLQGLMDVNKTLVMLATKLRTLHIERLPKLKRIWNEDTEHILSFQNLDIVTAVECPNVKSLFPASIARGLHRLTHVEINACGIEEIVSIEEREGARADFEFPQLTYLKLWKLSELKRFGRGVHTPELPKLKYLEVYDCDQTDIFTSEPENFHEEWLEDQLESVLQQPLFSTEEVIPNLEEMPLNSKDATMIWCRRRKFPADFFCNVKVLHLQCFQDESTSFPIGLIQRFNNLEKLTVVNSCFEDMFACEGLNCQENQGRTLAQIQHLRLCLLYNLKQIRLDHILKNLEILEVSECNRLINLAPSSASFQNLRILDVLNCKGLVNLVTFSTAESMVHLTKLSVGECRMMTEIIVKEGDDEKDEIIFHKLESLRLNCLPSLTNFCSANWTVKFPSLEEVIVRQCPKMKIFSHGVLHAPKLQRVKTEGRDIKPWQGDLNTTIKQLYTELVGFNGMQNLKLSEFAELKQRWPDHLPFSFFCNLHSLVVDWSGFYWCAVPFNLLPFLNVLEELEVRNCDSVEEVFDVEQLNADASVGYLSKLTKFCLIDMPRLRHVWDENPRGNWNFQNLKVLKFQNCGSLRYVFTPSVILGGLVQLQEIEIKCCPMIQEIVAKGISAQAIRYNFPLLYSITLESLPSLTSFYSGSGIVECPSLKKMAVVDCPNRFTYSFLREQKQNKADEIYEGKVALPHLETFRVEWSDTMEEFWHEQFRAEIFCNLKVFELIRFPNDYSAFPSCLLQRLPRLENLLVCDAYFEEIVLQKETTDDAQLRELKLSKLPNLKHLLKEDSHSCLVFQNLETLEVSECSRLKILVACLASFQFLKILEVSKCHGLIRLITSTTAKSLIQLTKMSITECEMIEGIVANGKNEAENEIVFSKLKYLRLHGLPSLMSFYSGKCALIFPSLEEVQVTECPKVGFFSQGVVSMPRLKKLQLTEGKVKGCWEGNLNAPIQQLFIEMSQAVRTPRTPRTPFLRSMTAEAQKNNTHAISSGQASRDLHATKNPDTDKNLPTEDKIIRRVSFQELDRACSLNIPEIIQMKLTSTDQATSSSNGHDHGVVETKPSLTRQPALESETAIAETGKMIADSDGQPSEDLCATKNLLPPKVEKTIKVAVEEQGIKCFSAEIGNTEWTPMNSQSLSTSNDKNKLAQDFVVLVSSIQQGSTMPVSPTAVNQIADRTSDSPANFEFVFSSVEDLLKRTPNSSSLSGSSSVDHTEFSESNGVSSEAYDLSMDQIREILKKSLTDVARSSEALLLLSNLKNLKNCPLLNSRQVEIIKLYIENFDSLVTCQPLYEQQIRMSNAIKLSIEDDKNGFDDLKNLYENYTSRTKTLSADKEVLRKRIKEIEEEEDLIHANVEVLYTNLVTRKGKLENNVNALLEALRQEKEAMHRASNANDQWAKLRRLFP